MYCVLYGECPGDTTLQADFPAISSGVLRENGPPGPLYSPSPQLAWWRPCSGPPERRVGDECRLTDHLTLHTPPGKPAARTAPPPQPAEAARVPALTTSPYTSFLALSLSPFSLYLYIPSPFLSHPLILSPPPYLPPSPIFSLYLFFQCLCLSVSLSLGVGLLHSHPRTRTRFPCCQSQPHTLGRLRTGEIQPPHPPHALSMRHPAILTNKSTDLGADFQKEANETVVGS